MTFGIVYVRRSFRGDAGNGTQAACAPQSGTRQRAIAFGVANTRDGHVPQTTRVNSYCKKFWPRRVVHAPIDWRSIGARLLQRNEFLLARLGRVLLAQRRIFGARLRIERFLL